MCGIAGILKWNSEKIAAEEILNLTNSVDHRGPDGLGIVLKENFAFGHRRLSIIDLEGGKQPMSNFNETIWITFNGEIYNYQELKKELTDFGYEFRTNSDTEVIIYSYEKWGIDCVKKFRGMFAFVIADISNKKYFLARDHFGIKPLVYRKEENYLAFSSEITALKKIENLTAEGNLQAIDFYLRYQYIPTPHTIYKNIYKLPPAHTVEIEFDGKMHNLKKYWDINFSEEKNKSENEWIEEIENVIDDSVKKHLVSDVPFGVFLSGGIDSSLIALKMQEVSVSKLKAFTINFHEKEFSELEYAKKAAAKCNAELISENITENALDILPDLVEHYGEPFGDSSSIPTWYVSKLAREHVPMVLSGDGGDETFGGYDSYIRWMKNHPLVNARSTFLENPYWGSRIALNGVKQFIKHRTFNVLESWQNHILYAEKTRREKLWKKELHYVINVPDKLFELASEKAVNYNRLSYAQYIDFQTYLPCDILNKVDIASMCHGLEVRPPFVDVKVVELATRLPLSMKYHKVKDFMTGKYGLKKIAQKYFDHEFVYRKKQGFGLPSYYWFLENKQGYKMLNTILQDNKSINQLFNVDEIKYLLKEHGKNNIDNAGILWLFLVLGLWFDKNKDVTFNFIK
jgi:asparagine synthase (glutamine-hydrolysing)